MNQTQIIGGTIIAVVLMFGVSYYQANDSFKEKKCTAVEMYVSDYKDESNTLVNPFLPKGVQCNHNGKYFDWFGK